MSGILDDNPNAEPPRSDGSGRLPWLSFALPKRKRPGRSRKLWLFPKYALAYFRGRSEEAYEKVAEQHYGAINPDSVKYKTDAEINDAYDRFYAAVAKVKRQVNRERRWLSKLERQERGGLLGK
jgi:hypothetical protein